MFPYLSLCLFRRPSVKLKNSNGPIEWRQPNPYTLDYLYLSKETIEMRQHFKAAKVALWNQLIPEIYKPSDNKEIIVNRTWTVLLGCVLVVLLLLLGFVLFLTVKRYCRSSSNKMHSTAQNNQMGNHDNFVA